MSTASRIVACLASLALAPVALAQTGATTSESTTVTREVRGGVVESVAGNKIVVREQDGLHEYTVPPGFTFQVNGQPVGVDQITPGTTVAAVITNKVTDRNVTVTRVASGRVMQVAPGGIVVRTPDGNLRSINFKDEAGNDIRFVRDGRQSVAAGNPEISLRDVRVGDTLTGTFVSTLPTQQITQRTVDAHARPPPQPAPAAPAATVAAATPPAKLPRTASPLPLLGLLALVSAGIALTLRAARTLG